MQLRQFVNKRLDIITQADIKNLHEFLGIITPWPWNLKQMLNITSQADLEFVTLSPEVINQLCEYIYYLQDIIQKQDLVNQTKGE